MQWLPAKAPSQEPRAPKRWPQRVLFDDVIVRHAIHTLWWTRRLIIRPALFDALRCRHGEARQRADQSAGKRRSSGKSANAVLLYRVSSSHQSRWYRNDRQG